jgi:hypothetical protein
MRNVSKYLRRNAVRIALSRECVLHRAAAESSNEDECRALEGRDKRGKMSGARPKRGMVPERPSQKKEPARASTADETPRDSAESSPALTDRPFLEGRAPKLLMLAATIVVGIMFLLTFSFCLAFGIKNKQPRYFLLLINIILSTGVTVLLVYTKTKNTSRKDTWNNFSLRGGICPPIPLWPCHYVVRACDI